jgi:hypothetical protein
MAGSKNSYFQFGTGAIFGIPVGGDRAANPTAQLFATVQDASMEMNGKLEQLRGQNKFPDDVAASDIDIKGKVQFGAINPELLNQLIYADTITTGVEIVVVKEAHSISVSPPTSTFTAAHFPLVDDLGVIDGITGSAFEAVASAPTVGQYTVVLSTGVYTFNAAEVTDALASYTYADASGNTLGITNQPQGYGPLCQMILDQPYQGNNAILLYAVRFNGTKVTEKRAGHTIIETDFEAFANPAGKVLDWMYTGNSKN